MYPFRQGGVSTITVKALTFQMNGRSPTLGDPGLFLLTKQRKYKFQEESVSCVMKKSYRYVPSSRGYFMRFFLFLILRSSLRLSGSFYPFSIKGWG